MSHNLSNLMNENIYNNLQKKNLFLKSSVISIQDNEINKLLIEALIFGFTKRKLTKITPL